MTTRLFDAVASIRYRQIEILLQCGVDINSKDQHGDNVLMIACDISDDKKRYKMFRYLVHKGADEFEMNHEGVSVFQYACATGRARIVKRMLKEKGLHIVHLSSKDGKNRNSLYHAVKGGQLDIVRFIVLAMKNQNISIDQVDIEGNTPLILAYKLKQPKIAKLLLEEGKANPRICDRECHLSANEWAEVCNQEIKEEKLMKSEKCREKKMIFPRIDHVAFRRQQAKKIIRDACKLPVVDEAIDNSSVVNFYGRMYPQSSLTASHSQTQTSESSVYSHVIRGKQAQSIHGKSIDSAMELLELASRGGGKRHYATTFVGSEPDTSKSMDDGGMISSMMDAYSIQNSSSFRKTVKPQPKPIPRAPPTRETKQRVSTLAIIMNRGGRTRSRVRKGPRASNKTSKRQSRPASRRKQTKQSKHQMASTAQKITEDKTTASSDVIDRRSLELIPEENLTNKKHYKDSLRNGPKFPDIGIRLVTQGVR